MLSWNTRALASCIVLALAAAATAHGAEYKGAPALEAQVQAGKLPPTAQRLPDIPFIETMVESVGKYGGTIRSAVLGGGDQYNLTRSIGNETLVRWTPDWKGIVPSIAERVEAGPDAKEYVFHLRRGMRWSDGHPFNADDIMFWYEDVFSRPELTPSKNPIFVADGKPVVVTKIDDYTVKFAFQSSYGLFLQQMAYGSGHIPIIYPKHYLQQFHIRYNPDGIREMLARSSSVKDWVSLFNSKVSLSFQPVFWQNLELPTLNSYVLREPYADGPRVVAERNPYYWKVDPAGNQLPYIDRWIFTKADDVQLLLLKAQNGEIDFLARHITNVAYKALLFDSQQRGGFRFFDLAQTDANDAVLLLNLNAADPVKRRIFQNKDFRMALSHAINRQEIIDLVYVGAGTPSQGAPWPGQDIYNERMATQYTQYDPARSNALLDGIGLDKRDAEGFRLGPDGKRFTIVFMVADVFGSGFPDIMLQVQKYAKAVGIDIQIRATDRARLNTMWYANEQEAYIWNCPGGLSDAYTETRCFMPNQKADLFYAIRWAEWYADPRTGEEPPPEVREHMAMYDRVKATATDAERLAAMRAFLERSADNFYNIGIARPAPRVAIVSRRMGNVLTPLPIAGNLWHPAPTLAQYYYR